MHLSLNYQHIIVEGLPYERGFSYGEQTKEKIAKSLAYYKTQDKLLPLDVCIRVIEDVYIPGIAKYFPEIVPELKGIAAGAGVHFNDIVLLNARYDLAQMRSKAIRPFPRKHTIPLNSCGLEGEGSANGLPGCKIYLEEESSDTSNSRNINANECTTAGFLAECTANGDVFVAQNWDHTADIYLNDTAVYLEIHPDPSEKLPAMFVMTEAGQLGRSGFNSTGLGLCASSLMSTEDYFPIDLSLPRAAKQEPLLPISLIRRKFLHNKNFANALQDVKTSPRHCSNNILLGTADSFVMALELTPSSAHICYPEKGDNFVVHANHFVSSSFYGSEWSDRYPGGSSFFRAERVAHGVRPYNERGITEKHVIGAFSDHLSMPSGVCQHLDDENIQHIPDYPYSGAQMTVTHVLYNLTQRSATVCKGPPCMGSFSKFNIEKTSYGGSGLYNN